MLCSRISPITSAVFLLVFCASATGQQGQQLPSPDFEPGSARGSISRVSCRDNPSQSYAVYLPSNYSPGRAWPIIYAFDPFARGQTAVEVYKAAAEKYGYIVAGSNNSRNGPAAEELVAAQAMWLDTHQRLSIDENRVYTTGLSGGARAATVFALYCYTCNVAGVIAHGAGYPVMQNAKQPANDHFAYYVAVGKADFNLPEILILRQEKDQAGAPCKVKIYSGPHQWAPPEVVQDAIEWLEVRAMQASTEKVNPNFVATVFEKTQAEADQAEQRGDVLTEYYALRSLSADFQGLEDTAQFAAKAAEVKSSKAFKIAKHKEQSEIEEQVYLTKTPSSELAQIAVADANDQRDLAQHVSSVMSDLRKRGNSSSGDHLVYSRAFTELWIQGLEAGQDAFRENNLSLAMTYFELMAQASPDQAWPLILLAEAQVRSRNKKAALKSIEQAVHRGLKRGKTLTEDPELQPLASDPEFQRIVQSLSGQ